MQKHDQWLHFANEDLRVANFLLKDENVAIGAVLYHVQQSMEKALKAFIIYKSIKPERTHDLVSLVYNCADYDSVF